MASSCGPTVAEYQALVESLRDIVREDAKLVDDRIRLLDAFTNLTEKNEVLVEEQKKMREKYVEDQRVQLGTIAALEEQNNLLRQRVEAQEDEINGLEKELTGLKDQLSGVEDTTVREAEMSTDPRAKMTEQEKEKMDQDLLNAAENGKLEDLRALLANGANVNYTNGSGWSSLTVATIKSHLQIVEVLLANGGNVNHADTDAWTALMLAAEGGHLQIVEVLLANGANVNHADKTGDTALMQAALRGHSNVVEALIKRGAFLNMRDSGGETALMLADGRGHKETSAILRRAGARK